MIDHVSLAVRDLVASAEAYERMLVPLGLLRLVERSGAVGFGKRYPELWLNHRPRQIAMPPDTGAHVCLRASDEGAVRAFHAAALAGGCKDAGAPGPRQAAITMYFAAFVFDLDGNKVEAASFPRDPAQILSHTRGYGSQAASRSLVPSVGFHPLGTFTLAGAGRAATLGRLYRPAGFTRDRS
jgi:catechol 2,3-dioxygenase-like lactoylglutathione lyase family enzyme